MFFFSVYPYICSKEQYVVLSFFYLILLFLRNVFYPVSVYQAAETSIHGFDRNCSRFSGKADTCRGHSCSGWPVGVVDPRVLLQRTQQL